MSKAKSGGGITSNKFVRTGVETGGPYKATSPGASDHMGQSTKFKKERVDLGRAYTTSKLGNELTLNVGKGAPGAGRTVMRSGSQGTHGQPAQGEAGMQGDADRGPRAILGPPGNKP